MIEERDEPDLDEPTSLPSTIKTKEEIGRNFHHVMPVQFGCVREGSAS